MAVGKISVSYFEVSLQFRSSSAPNYCKGKIVPLYWLLIVLAIVFMLSECNGALDTGEKAALHQLFEAFPALAHVPKWFNSEEYEQRVGGSWRDNYEELCLEDGYGYYGVFCHSGHVTGLYVYASFNHPLSF